MNSKTLLLTGATGIMGSWVLGEALRRGYGVSVILRDKDADRAEARLRTVLQHVARTADRGRVRLLRGDATLPGFGLSHTEAAALRASIGGVVHCAACTSFNSDDDDKCWQTNYTGVGHLLEFLSGTDIPLYHVSTAYVAGLRRGRVRESELDEGQTFANTYEDSKCQAEKKVRAALDSGQIRGSIFRPSIITGATQDGRILQFMNFYNLLRFIDMIRLRKRSQPGTVRVETSFDGTKNLIPVDWTARALWTIIENEGPSGEVYHLTNPQPIGHETVQALVNYMLAPRGIQVDMVDELDDTASSLERMFSQSLANYKPYMGSEPVFDRANTDRALRGAEPFPELDAAYFAKLLAFAQENNWRSLFEARKSRSAEIQRIEAVGAEFPIGALAWEASA